MTAKEFILDYVLNHPDNKDDKGEPYFSDLKEFFEECGFEYNWKEVTSSSRWWTNLFVVQVIDGKFIGYEWAETTEDKSIWDTGWEFDENSICFVEPYEILQTCYRPIK